MEKIVSEVEVLRKEKERLEENEKDLEEQIGLDNSRITELEEQLEMIPKFVEEIAGKERELAGLAQKLQEKQERLNEI